VKTLLIDHCYKCPYRLDDIGEGLWFCRKSYRKILEDEVSIPKWCELSDKYPDYVIFK